VQSGLIDTSQKLNRYNFRNQKLNGHVNNRKFGSLEWELPSEGIFEVRRTTFFFARFIYKYDLFTKTGSGQT
jgi:hypothetical protein